MAPKGRGFPARPLRLPQQQPSCTRRLTQLAAAVPMPAPLLQENLKGLLTDLMEHHWEQLQVEGRAGSRGLADAEQRRPAASP